MLLLDNHIHAFDMNDLKILDIPEIYPDIEVKSKNIGFAMTSDLLIGTLLKTLITSKPQSNFLEIGTGTGLSLSWMLAGMDEKSKLTTIDNDPELIKISKSFFGNEKNLNIICADGSEWIKNYKGEKFDLIFADAWPGKYTETNEILELLNVGAFYIIDDMDAQPNWPVGHQEKVNDLIDRLEERTDLNLTKLNWSTGIIIASKKA